MPIIIEMLGLNNIFNVICIQKPPCPGSPNKTLQCFDCLGYPGGFVAAANRGVYQQLLGDPRGRITFADAMIAVDFENLIPVLWECTFFCSADGSVKRLDDRLFLLDPGF